MGEEKKKQLVEAVVGRLARRHTTASVLFHHAVAERLQLGPTDHKCLDLLRECEAMTGSELAAMTGLTTGAVTGVVARLERAGYLRREPDPEDGRKQILRPIPDRVKDVSQVIAPLRTELTHTLERFDEHQLTAIVEFLVSSTDIARRNAALLRVAYVGDTPTEHPWE